MTAPSTTSLIAAIRENDTAALRALLEAGVDPNTIDPREELPCLFFAVEADAQEVVGMLLDAGADVNATASPGGWSALMAAVASDAPEMVALLLERGADVQYVATRSDGDTALTFACKGEFSTPDPTVVQHILDAGADPNAPRGDGWTPLMLIAQRGDLDIARLLLDAGADPSQAKGEGESRTTAIGVAEHWGSAAMVALLREAGVEDPLEAAVERVRAIWAEIDAWFKEHAPERHERLAEVTGATPEAIAKLEATLGQRLPVDLKAHLTLYGGERSSNVAFMEYAGLGVRQIARTWEMMKELKASGSLNHAPRELSAYGRERVQAVWWDEGWVPFCEDGGGNSYCVDLNPARGVGTRGQVIMWEVHAGPVGPVAGSFEEHLRGLRDKLLSGRYVYDPNTGIFDER